MHSSSRTCLQFTLLLSHYMHCIILKSAIRYFNKVASLETAKTFINKPNIILSKFFSTSLLTASSVSSGRALQEHVYFSLPHLFSLYSIVLTSLGSIYMLIFSIYILGRRACTLLGSGRTQLTLSKLS